MCKSIISVVDEIVDHQDVDNSIRKIVPEVCKYLPSDTHHKVI